MRNRKEKALYENRQEIIDHKTGEVKESVSNRVVRIANDEPPFIKFYLNTAFSSKNLSKAFNPVLFELLKYMSYADPQEPQGGQMIYLNPELRRKISSACEISQYRLNQVLTELVKSGVFTRISNGTFQVNPGLFGKGDWRDIKNIQAKIDFGEGTIDRTIIEFPSKESRKKEAV